MQNINIDETPEKLFSQYKENYSLKILQKLYNLGFHLHTIQNGIWKRSTEFEINLEKHRIIMLYDKIGDTMKFTKIGFYNKK